jgi:hypothetical protein
MIAITIFDPASEPDISNNVGSVKSFFGQTFLFAPKSGLRCFLLTSAHRAL